MKKLIVAGAYPSGPGYPNVTNTVERLEKDGSFEIEYAGVDLGKDLRLWREARRGWLARLLRLATLAWRNLHSVVLALHRARMQTGSFVYIPHPPLPAMLIFSLLPARWRPVCIADSYICVWDAIVRDRNLLRERSFLARLLRRIEAHALSAADHIVVDTAANASMLSQQLGVCLDQVAVLPLVINERVYRHANYVPSNVGRCKVLFVGTLVPLHGIEEIVAALRELEGQTGLEFLVVGDGQQAKILEEYIASGPSLALRWERRWMDESELNQTIAGADICLGVFGGGGKASRVLPFKLYSYFRVGRAVISQRIFGTPAPTEEIPFHPVDASQGRMLAAAIRHLAEQPLERVALAEQGARYYERYLGNQPFLRGWNEMVAEPVHRRRAR